MKEKNLNKTVIITGGAIGIGRQISIDFAKSGYNVCVNYNNSEQKAKDLKNELEKNGINIEIFKADVSIRDEVDDMVSYALQKYRSIDVLVNNSGICDYNLFQDVSQKRFKELIDVNLLGVFNTTQSVLSKYMINAKYGKIINISSIWGITGGSCEVVYSMTKAGIIGMSKALAKELGPSNINVNVVAPGVIQTDMIKNLTEEDLENLKDEIPLGRIGDAKDISKTVLFLASDDSNYITGQVISPNGGMVI